MPLEHLPRKLVYDDLASRLSYLVRWLTWIRCLTNRREAKKGLASGGVLPRPAESICKRKSTTDHGNFVSHGSVSAIGKWEATS